MNHRPALAALVVAATIALTACGGSPTSAPATAAPATSAPAPTVAEPTDTPEVKPTEKPTEKPAATEAPSATEAAATPEANATPQMENFDPANFDEHSAEITNPWLPLKPGTHYVYEGNTVRDDGALVPHRIEITVSDLTKVIAGVRAIATWDLDYTEDVLEEAELAFYAQDKAGTIWRMGEYPEVYQDGKYSESPSWIHGYAGALAGIMMLADPKPGTPSYAEGWGPAVDWTDRGQVDAVGQSTCVLVDCYKDVLVIAESSLTEKDAVQLKYYASGVGNVRVGWRGAGDKSKESMELTKFEQLSPEDLADVHGKVLALEKSAYEHSKDVYANTPPMEPIAAAK